VSHNQISDLSFLKNLIHLDTLYLSSNRITDLSQLSQLTELQELAIGNNQFTDLTPVANLTKMTLLVMCDCKADSLEPLYAMKDLFELRVSRNTYSQEELAALKTAIPGCTINQY
jgi:Leucine-rich repeat (LRR) protein